MAAADSNAEKWIRLEKGIRYREHPTRKHGVKKDRYFVLRYTVEGEKRQEALGWASEGMTLEKARIELGRLKEAVRTGEGPCTLAERRELAAQKRQQDEERMRQGQRAAITFGEYWSKTYWPAQTHKAEGSKVAENVLWTKWLKPHIENISLCKLAATDLEKVKNSMLTAEKSSASLKYAMSVVSQLWNMAVRDGLVSGVSPTRHIALPKKDNRRQRYLTSEEAYELLEALKPRSKASHDMALVSLDCGLRFGEIAALTWKDCDLAGERLFIRDPKARANRFAFMTPRVHSLFEGLQQQAKDKNGLIFTTAEGKIINRISNVFRQVADELFNEGITDPRQRVCFHTLRHTYASRLVEGGVSLYAVKELLGHADLKMTQRYSHLSPTGLKDAIAVLSSEPYKG